MAHSFFIELLLAGDPRADKQALRLYHKAARRAQRRLHTKGIFAKMWIGADEVATELEWLLRGVCYFFNCLDSAAYARLNQAILNWTPVSSDPQLQLPCGMVQNGLLALLPQLQQKQRLEHLCTHYQDHLDQAARAETKEQSQPEDHLKKVNSSSIQIPTCTASSHPLPQTATQPAVGISDPLSQIYAKQAAVGRLRQVWETRQNLSTQYRHFQHTFQQERRILEKDRDSAAVIFLKAVATVLSFGLAALCGLWSVKGQKAVEKMEQVFEDATPSA